MVEGFLLFSDYAETIRTLTDSAAGILIKMIFNHVTGADVNEGIEDQAGADYDSAKIAFGFIRRQVDRSIESYEELRAKRREAGTKGAEKRWQSHSKAIANDGKECQSQERVADICRRSRRRCRASWERGA